MSESKKWKDRLLSSSFPLEYEVSKILAKHRYHVKGEFSYIRHENGKDVEFSTDNLAHMYVSEDEKDDGYIGKIDLLIECKYRNESKIWLFQPDETDPDFSSTELSAIREFRGYTTYEYDSKNIRYLTRDIPAALKCIEMNKKSDEVQSKDVKHACNQLRYALPHVIHKNIIGNTCHPDDAKPFFIIPIIITNAPLCVVNEDFGIETIKEATSDIESLYTEHPVVDLYSPLSETFEEHANRIYDRSFNRGMGHYNNFVRKYLFDRNIVKITDFEMMTALRGMVRQTNLYSQFLVVNFAHFDAYLGKITSGIQSALNKSKQVVFKSP
jgi:hypothetical protein